MRSRSVSSRDSITPILVDRLPFSSGRSGSGSMKMYSKAFPSGSSKNTDAAGVQAKTYVFGRLTLSESAASDAKR